MCVCVFFFHLNRVIMYFHEFDGNTFIESVKNYKWKVKLIDLVIELD